MGILHIMGDSIAPALIFMVLLYCTTALFNIKINAIKYTLLFYAIVVIMAELYGIDIISPKMITYFLGSVSGVFDFFSRK